jgi:hypothetical protein
MLRVFVAAGTWLTNRCLATKGGISFIELLPTNCRKDAHTDPLTDIKYAVEMGTGAMIEATYVVS